MAGIQLTLKRSDINKKLGNPGEGMSWIPEELFRGDLPPGPAHLMMNLLTYENNENRTLKDIGGEIGASVATVRNYLRILEERGWLTYTPVPLKAKAKGREETLYRLYDREGSLLYVGITNDIFNRWKEHSNDKHWFEDVHRFEREVYPDRESVEHAERIAIQDEGPRYNVANNRGGNSAVV